jgi:hypothetical protein
MIHHFTPRLSHALVAVLVAGQAVAADQGNPIPAALPIERYVRLIQHSPFAPATPQATEEAKPSFADQLYVTGIAKLGAKDCVFISSKDKKETYSLVSGEGESNGLQLLAVEWSDEVGKTKVRVKKGVESGVLAFDQAVVMQTPTVTQIPNAGLNASAPQPGKRPAIVPGGRPGQLASGAQPQPTTRRRFRVINPNSQ